MIAASEKFQNKLVVVKGNPQWTAEIDLYNSKNLLETLALFYHF